MRWMLWSGRITAHVQTTQNIEWMCDTSDGKVALTVEDDEQEGIGVVEDDERTPNTRQRGSSTRHKYPRFVVRVSSRDAS